ncbi:hypothetical protein SAMN05216316_2663 [Nitrosovibrio sp. Nv6]|nr:hypothetical protein SAMN05216316_2663 [Nitrosovibrio sp. Nv6]
MPISGWVAFERVKIQRSSHFTGPCPAASSIRVFHGPPSLLFPFQQLHHVAVRLARLGPAHQFNAPLVLVVVVLDVDMLNNS